MRQQTKFKFGDEWYVFWLINWIDPKKGPMLMRCEELQSPLAKLALLQAERATAYQFDVSVDRLQTPFESIEPCQIANLAHKVRIDGWLAKFGEKNLFQSLIESNGIEKPYSQTVDFKQDKLF